MPAFHRAAAGRLALLLAMGAVVFHLRAFLPPDTLPARGDPSLPFQGSDLTPHHAPALRAAMDAVWSHGTLPFWAPHANAGSPLFESPDVGVVSLATLLGALAPPDAAIKWSALLHVLLGMAGVFAFARALGARRPFAAFGALAFGLSTYLLDHLRAGHLSFVNPMAFLPWALYALHRALEAQRRGLQWALLAGAAAALALLEGGTTPVVYGGVALALAVLAVPFGPRRWDRLRWLAAWGLAAAVTAFALAAFQLLPMLSYLSLTGRAGGLTLEHALWRMSEVAQPVPPAPALALMAAGVVALAVRPESAAPAGAASRRRGAALWLAAVVALGFAAATWDGAFALLWRYVPGFRFQRIPQRALVLVAVAGPVLLACGADGLWRALAGRARGAGAALALALFGWTAWAIARAAPAMPPMYSPAREQQSNAALRWIAEHGAGSRMHVWESPNRHWGSDNVTQPLGLEPLTSYTPAEHRDYLPGDFDPPGHRTFLGDSYRHPARFWGLLDVRFVTSTMPRDVPGFRLAAQVPRCPIEVCQPAKSAGPYVYENQRWMGRAWRVPSALALVGPARPTFEAALEVMGEPAFDPSRVVVLQLGEGEPVPPGVDGLVAVATDVEGVPRFETPEGRQAVREVLARAAAVPLVRGSAERHGPNRLTVRAPGEGWLVISEKLALYPGWRARAAGREIPIFRADGVIAAVAAPPGAEVELAYRPPRLGPGLSILVVAAGGALAAVAAARARAWRRANR